VLVLRDETERPEGVTAGCARLVGAGTERIVTEAQALLDDPSERRRMARATCPYGDGHAAEACVDAITRHFAGHAAQMDLA
jgi:UDP-N-acetylglucosamine 2-epimerase (non-hydrolysing)